MNCVTTFIHSQVPQRMKAAKFYNVLHNMLPILLHRERLSQKVCQSFHLHWRVSLHFLIRYEEKSMETLQASLSIPLHVVPDWSKTRNPFRKQLKYLFKRKGRKLRGWSTLGQKIQQDINTSLGSWQTSTILQPEYRIDSGKDIYSQVGIIILGICMNNRIQVTNYFKYATDIDLI